MSDASLGRAQQYYARLRRSAYEFVREDVIASGDVQVPLRLSNCDSDALAAWRKTWQGSHPSGWGNWDWEPLLRRTWKDPAGFHLAIWSDDVLCGLAVGRVSNRDRAGGRNAVSLHYVESAHDPLHPLRGKILFLAIAAAQAYGRNVGARWLRLVGPLPGLIAKYEQLGFTTVWNKGRAVYCERRIES